METEKISDNDSTLTTYQHEKIRIFTETYNILIAEVSKLKHSKYSEYAIKSLEESSMWVNKHIATEDKETYTSESATIMEDKEILDEEENKNATV